MSRTLATLPYRPATYSTDSDDDLYAIPWDYLDKAHIRVHVGGTLRTTGWTIPNKGSLSYPNKPTGTLVISRCTPDAELLVEFNNAAPLKASSFNRQSKWQLFITQEIAYETYLRNRGDELTQEDVDERIAALRPREIPAGGSDGDALFKGAGSAYNWRAPRELPAYPAEGSRDNKALVFVGNNPAWRDTGPKGRRIASTTVTAGLGDAGTAARSASGATRDIAITVPDWTVHDGRGSSYFAITNAAEGVTPKMLTLDGRADEVLGVIVSFVHRGSTQDLFFPWSVDASAWKNFKSQHPGNPSFGFAVFQETQNVANKFITAFTRVRVGTTGKAAAAYGDVNGSGTAFRATAETVAVTVYEWIR